MDPALQVSFDGVSSLGSVLWSLWVGLGILAQEFLLARTRFSSSTHPGSVGPPQEEHRDFDACNVLPRVQGFMTQ